MELKSDHVPASMLSPNAAARLNRIVTKASIPGAEQQPAAASQAVPEPAPVGGQAAPVVEAKDAAPSIDVGYLSLDDESKAEPVAPKEAKEPEVDPEYEKRLDGLRKKLQKAERAEELESEVARLRQELERAQTASKVAPLLSDDDKVALGGEEAVNAVMKLFGQLSEQSQAKLMERVESILQSRFADVPKVAEQTIQERLAKAAAAQKERAFADAVRGVAQKYGFEWGKLANDQAFKQMLQDDPAKELVLRGVFQKKSPDQRSLSALESVIEQYAAATKRYAAPSIPSRSYSNMSSFGTAQPSFSELVQRARAEKAHAMSDLAKSLRGN